MQARSKSSGTSAVGDLKSLIDLRYYSRILAGILGFLVLGQAPHVVGGETLELGGFLSDTTVSVGLEVESEAGVRWSDDPGGKLELLLSPDFRLEFPDGPMLVSTLRARGDAFDELEPGRPDQDARAPQTRRVLIGDHGDFELREFYLEHAMDEFFIRLGKQQIVWGQADGLKVLDVVNPQSFREFILDDFDDSRIPLWSATVEAPVGGATLQFVWLPDQTYHEFPEAGAAFSPTAPQIVPAPVPGVAVVTRDADRPSRIVEDSDVGLRLSGFWDGWDLTANYLYHYPDAPGFFVEPVLGAPVPTAAVTPRYERSHLFGGSFSNSFGDLVVRGEVAYSTNRLFVADGAREPDRVVRADELAYVLGFDWYGFDDLTLSAQAFQNFALGDPADLVRDQVDTTLTFLASREFLDGDLTLDVIWLTDLRPGDGLLRPKVSYKMYDDLDVWIGADIFYGSEEGAFGQFGDQDRVTAGFRWTW